VRHINRRAAASYLRAGGNATTFLSRNTSSPRRVPITFARCRSFKPQPAGCTLAYHLCGDGRGGRRRGVAPPCGALATISAYLGFICRNVQTGGTCNRGMVTLLKILNNRQDCGKRRAATSGEA